MGDELIKDIPSGDDEEVPTANTALIVGVRKFAMDVRDMMST